MYAKTRVCMRDARYNEMSDIYTSLELEKYAATIRGVMRAKLMAVM